MHAAFENHLNTYKITYPLRDEKVVSAHKGTRYLGEGKWGRKAETCEEPESDLWYVNYPNVVLESALLNVP